VESWWKDEKENRKYSSRERNLMTNIYYPVRPKPAPRPRVTKYGTYNNKDYTEWKNGLKLLAKTKIKKPITEPITMKIEFFYEIPKSWTKKKKAEAKWHTSKPDIDNLVKQSLTV
jgi:Holliday junction resolvase RusA-like endonuclease